MDGSMYKCNDFYMDYYWKYMFSLFSNCLNYVIITDIAKWK